MLKPYEYDHLLLPRLPNMAVFAGWSLESLGVYVHVCLNPVQSQIALWQRLKMVFWARNTTRAFTNVKVVAGSCFIICGNDSVINLACIITKIVKIIRVRCEAQAVIFKPHWSWCCYGTRCLQNLFSVERKDGGSWVMHGKSILFHYRWSHVGIAPRAVGRPHSQLHQFADWDTAFSNVWWSVPIIIVDGSTMKLLSSLHHCMGFWLCWYENGTGINCTIETFSYVVWGHLS